MIARMKPVIGTTRIAARRDRDLDGDGVSVVPIGGPQATRRALAKVGDARAILLVEGISDQVALETLAARRGRDLAGEGISVVPIGGAQAIGRFLTRFASKGSNARLAGLCDAGEEHVFRRSLERAGYGSHLTRDEMERLGFYVCVADLEDELIRALGPASVEAVLESHGDLGSFRTFQKQPAWRGQRIEAQLRRFLRSADRRNIRYARLLVDALDPAQVPRPLDGVLAHV
jgi:OLD-like protein